MFKALYSHVNNIIEKYYKFTTISYYIYNQLKQLLNHLIHNEKLNSPHWCLQTEFFEKDKNQTIAVQFLWCQMISAIVPAAMNG